MHCLDWNAFCVRSGSRISRFLIIFTKIRYKTPVGPRVLEFGKNWNYVFWKKDKQIFLEVSWPGPGGPGPGPTKTYTYDAVKQFWD